MLKKEKYIKVIEENDKTYIFLYAKTAIIFKKHDDISPFLIADNPVSLSVF